ncbi:hypothetical protein L226DRAFT_472166 [Lentinus tigrinus ALCF2SS1-7]|uniref:Protein kinase domain-containing protein n=1 Tax=Lentinus tigrinus ALCF2SS1-6 TaxID=1328759 RepID=A0A5C2RSQ4_9APHY|nr:hypothetical protein L227DRAFT_512065 [Lentinus tigrinus ALCF2SS1-6]RPD69220.1 hypothetical protein L226DRAFT_472166 [Lentinus tigrinus ALCF2SS1-7]
MVIKLRGITRTFIFKVAFGRRHAKDLKKEAKLYEGKLHPLCGKAVPIYYGYYMGETYEGLTGVMMLEDCGRPLRVPLRQQPIYFRGTVLTHLIDIHRAGVALDAFGLGHIVATKVPGTDDKLFPVIIDFLDANDAHKCEYEGDFTFYEPIPYPTEVACSQIWRAFMDADTFWPRYVSFFGKDIPVEYAKSVETLKEHGNPREGTSQYLIDRTAYVVVKDYYDWRVERKRYDQGKARTE